MLKNCKICDKQFVPPTQNVKNGYGFYCNKKCYWKAMVGRKISTESIQKRILTVKKSEQAICEICPKSFERFRYAKLRNQGRYCSRECFFEYLKRNKKIKYCPICKKIIKRLAKMCRACNFDSIRKENEKYKKHCIGCDKIISKKSTYCIKCYYQNPENLIRRREHMVALQKKYAHLTVGFPRGSKHPNWKGGITRLQNKIRGHRKYRDLRLKIFKRDWFTCQACGDKTRVGNKIKIQLEHIVPLSLIVRQNNIKTLPQALACEKLWDEKNLTTLCIPCHQKTDTFGGKYFAYLFKNKL